MIGATLQQLHPHTRIEYQWIESEGDRPPRKFPRPRKLPLTDAGGKGLFTRAIERALLHEQADLAVHSLKDLPTIGTERTLTIAAVPPRADVRDCLISQGRFTSISELPQGAKVGTASPRRAAQLLAWRDDLQIELIRGNVETRLRKVLDDRQYDATLLAMAGLHRAGLAKQASHPIDTTEMLPAAGQGALAIQCRGDDDLTLRRCLPLNDPVTATAVHAERAIVHHLGGDCHSPMAVLIEPIGERGVNGFRLRVKVLAKDGSHCLQVDEHGKGTDLARCVKQTVKQLKDRGSDALLKS